MANLLFALVMCAVLASTVNCKRDVPRGKGCDISGTWVALDNVYIPGCGTIMDTVNQNGCNPSGLPTFTRNDSLTTVRVIFTGGQQSKIYSLYVYGYPGDSTVYPFGLQLIHVGVATPHPEVKNAWNIISLAPGHSVSVVWDKECSVGSVYPLGNTTGYVAFSPFTRQLE